MQVLPISRKSPQPDGQVQSDATLTGKRRRLPKPGPLFLLVVVAPVIASIVYFGFIASDVYVSESQFVIRSPQKPTQTSLGAILQTAGFSNAGDEADAAQSFAESRDALRALNHNGDFQKAYTRPSISIADRYNPLGLKTSFEKLYRYFQGKVSLNKDGATNALVLQVRAYTPDDAYRFNRQLLDLTEATVNRLNERGRNDLIQYAQSEVSMAKERSQSAALALAAYRNRSRVVDPQMEAQAQMQMISNLQTQLIAARAELAQVQRYAPENPRIPVLQTQISTIESQINAELGKVTGGRNSLAGNTVQFQRLTLESDFADKQLAAALSSLEQAKDDARRKQAYVERIVQANLPDGPVGPLRLRGIFATLVLSLIAYGILRMLLAGVKEHAQ